MRPIFGFALYSPSGRISDFFRSVDLAPRPRRWGNYRAADTEVNRVYVGDMTEAAQRQFFELGAPGARGEDYAQHLGAQARFRNRWLSDHILDMLADVPSIDPAD